MTFPPGLALALRTAALRRALLACDKLTQDVRGASAHVECKCVVHPHFVVVAPADLRMEMVRSGSPLGIGHLANGDSLAEVLAIWPTARHRRWNTNRDGRFANNAAKHAADKGTKGREPNVRETIRIQNNNPPPLHAGGKCDGNRGRSAKYCQ